MRSVKKPAEKFFGNRVHRYSMRTPRLTEVFKINEIEVDPEFQGYRPPNDVEPQPVMVVNNPDDSDPSALPGQGVNQGQAPATPGRGSPFNPTGPGAVKSPEVVSGPEGYTGTSGEKPPDTQGKPLPPPDQQDVEYDKDGRPIDHWYDDRWNKDDSKNKKDVKQTSTDILRNMIGTFTDTARAAGGKS